MIVLSSKAEQHLDALRRHYLRLERVDALLNLLEAVENASDIIELNPRGGLASPRPYPEMAKAGRAWVKTGRYWISYRTSDPPVITGIFFETADIPKRS